MTAKRETLPFRPKPHVVSIGEGFPVLTYATYHNELVEAQTQVVVENIGTVNVTVSLFNPDRNEDYSLTVGIDDEAMDKVSPYIMICGIKYIPKDKPNLYRTNKSKDTFLRTGNGYYDWTSENGTPLRIKKPLDFKTLMELNSGLEMHFEEVEHIVV